MRLIDPAQMGNLFKVLALTSPGRRRRPVSRGTPSPAPHEDFCDNEPLMTPC